MAKGYSSKGPTMTNKNMKVARLELGEWGYEVVEFSDHEIQNLGHHLCDEICCDAKEMTEDIDWDSDGEDLSSGNITYFGVCNGKVVIGDLFSHMKDDPLCELELQKDQYWKAIHQWENLYKKKPDEIIITLDDRDNIELTGTNWDKDDDRKNKAKKSNSQQTIEPETWPKRGLLIRSLERHHVVRYDAPTSVKLLGYFLAEIYENKITKLIRTAIKEEEPETILYSEDHMYDLYVELLKDSLYLANAEPEEQKNFYRVYETEISKTNFLEILDTFENYANKKVKEMVISQYEDGHYELSPSNGNERN